MARKAVCPGCGEENRRGDKYCSKCGKALLPCPRCGGFNTGVVEFCGECGERLPSRRAPVVAGENPTEKPYIVYEGFPYAWMEKRSQTKTQFFLSLGFGLALVAVIFIPIMLILATAALRGEPGAASAFWVLTAILVLSAIFGWFRWWVGREGADEEEIEREKEEVY